MTLAAARLWNQRLVGTPLPTPEAVVDWLGAVQAQDVPGAAWAVALRTSGLTLEGFGEALDAGTILRTHVLRPTWHLVRPDDLRWMLALTAPRVKAAMASYDRQLEIDEMLITRSHDLIAGALADGHHRTRKELSDILRAGGVEAKGSRLAHLVMHAELDALVCSGRRRGAQQTYALVDERAPSGLEIEGDDAIAALAQRYLRGHGPATPHDFAWWAGLTVAAARHGLAMLGTDAETVEVDGTTYWSLASSDGGPVPTPTIHLLPNFDEHVVAYRDHGPSLHPAAPDALKGWGTGGSHQVVRDGLVVGGWRRTLRPDHAGIDATLLDAFTDDELAGLTEAAQDFERFLERPVELDVQRAGAS